MPRNIINEKLTFKTDLEEKIRQYNNVYDQCYGDEQKIALLKIIAVFANAHIKGDKLKDKFLTPFRERFHHFLTQNNHLSKELLSYIKTRTVPLTRICLLKGSKEAWSAYLELDKPFELGKTVVRRCANDLLKTVPPEVLGPELEKHASGDRTRKKLKKMLATSQDTPSATRGNPHGKGSDSTHLFFSSGNAPNRIPTIEEQLQNLQEDLSTGKEFNLKSDGFSDEQFTSTANEGQKRKRSPGNQQLEDRRKRVPGVGELNFNGPIGLMHALLSEGEKESENEHEPGGSLLKVSHYGLN